ncbi:MAG TPA: hypothetical protein VE110_07205, partial [Gemmatimonadaceae bacterium]|nr:hypothetical protein [Gemmatimonadaceae bacterium]
MRTEAKRPASPKARDNAPPSEKHAAGNGAAGPPPPTEVPGTTVEQRRELLKSMLIQRRFEERCAEAYALGKIGGFC